LNEAGSFSGNLPINNTTNTYDVYNSTVPGLTSMYVMRNEKCVCGGIVSGREYNAKDRNLSVTADDFVSYLDRRVLWKTWSTRYSCRIDVSDMTIGGQTVRIGKVTLRGFSTFLSEEVTAGESVFISFGSEKDKDLEDFSGNYTILSDPGLDEENGKFLYFAAYYRPVSGKNFRPIPADRYAAAEASVEFNQTTKRFLKNLIKNHFNDDTYDLGFAADSIDAGKTQLLSIAGLSRTNNEVTITVDSRDERHNLVVGQRIAIRDLTSPLAGLNTEKTKVTAIVDNLRFKYSSPGVDIAGTVPTRPEYTVTHYQRVNNIVTLITSTAHGFQVGDLVSITGEITTRLGARPRHIVTSVGEVAEDSDNDPDKVLQFELKGPRLSYSRAPGGARIRKIPVVNTYTGGPFTANSDIGIIFDDESFEALNSTDKIQQDGIRGYELLTFKEIIDKYSDDVFGFDYRIDCSYDPETNSFIKEFRFLPLVPSSVVAALVDRYGGTAPVELGKIDTKLMPAMPEDAPRLEIADFEAEGRVFEYPGNITDVSMSETIEEGATRVWAQGNFESLSDVISQPYAGIGDFTFLNRGWPIFDKVIRKDKISRSESLYSTARSVLGQAQLPVSTFSIQVNGSLMPEIGSYRPGDWCVVAINDLFIQERVDSYYENRGFEGRSVLLRKIAAIEVSVPINPAFPEIATLTLVTEPGIDIAGDESKWRWPTSSGGGSSFVNEVY
jgi:hypothetical protein